MAKYGMKDQWTNIVNTKNRPLYELARPLETKLMLQDAFITVSCELCKLLYSEWRMSRKVAVTLKTLLPRLSVKSILFVADVRNPESAGSCCFDTSTPFTFRS